MKLKRLSPKASKLPFANILRHAALHSLTEQIRGKMQQQERV